MQRIAEAEKGTKPEKQERNSLLNRPRLSSIEKEGAARAVTQTPAFNHKKLIGPRA